jgi:hypothetical protein
VSPYRLAELLADIGSAAQDAENEGDDELAATLRKEYARLVALSEQDPRR